MTLEDFLATHPKRHLIFDMDGTLFDLHIDWAGYMDGLYRAFAPVAPDYARYLAQDEFAFTNAVVSRYGEPAKQMYRDYNREFERAHFRGATEHTVLADFIRTHPGYRYYLWTSNSRATVLPVLERAGLASSFSAIAACDDTMLLKPDAEGFAFFNLAQEQKESTLMIGDSEADRGAAASCGISFISVHEIT